MILSSRYSQARILWLRGFADQAKRVVESNVEEGLALGQALSFCSVLGQAACPIALFAGDLDAAERHGAMLLAHAERQQIRLWTIWARCFNGLVRARRGDIRGGLRNLSDGLEQVGDARLLPRFLFLRGEQALLLGTTGEAEQALDSVEQMLTRCAARDERWYMAELLRIKGELMLLAAIRANRPASKRCFWSRWMLHTRKERCSGNSEPPSASRVCGETPAAPPKPERY